LGGWAANGVSTEDREREAYKALGKGKVDFGVRVKLIGGAMYGPGYGGRFERVDNGLLGIKGIAEGELEELVRGVVGGKQGGSRG